MTTWTSKGPLLAAALLLLTGCEVGPVGSGAAPKGLSQARMGGGALRLVPPPGYCIDQGSLKARFALLARCDAFAAVDTVSDAPRGMITFSMLPAPAGAELPSPETIAKAARLTRLSEVESTAAETIFRAVGPVPVKGVSPRHWRAAALIDGQLVGIALYGPEDGRAITGDGRMLIKALIARSRAANP
ncbi:hypothetical protein ACFSUD_08680 [Sulfitobacter aestuarii]|uniref:Dihydroxy-acid dehydratase n=1 Tax=Sulfitobacter aestuarii TaxID=2161676 RepID=A0ABW5U3M5_9RHOB